MSPQRVLASILLAPARWIERLRREDRARLASSRCDMCGGCKPAGTRLCDGCDMVERCAP